MEWRESENAEASQPKEIDFDYGSNVVFVRKDFVKKESDGAHPEHWKYLETKIPLSDWEYYKKLMQHDTEIGEAQDAAVELANVATNNTSQIEELQNAIVELGAVIGGGE